MTPDPSGSEELEFSSSFSASCERLRIIWVSLGVALPTESGRYLVHTPSKDPANPFVSVARFDRDSEVWSPFGDKCTTPITRWVNFPQPRGQGGLRTTSMTQLLALVLICAAPPFSGKVIGVSDGDTITVLRDRTPVKVRLNGVDAPSPSNRSAAGPSSSRRRNASARA
jgi:hypothetical protein